jgi:FAD-dependent oxidoreductase domain-containing protein 1
VVIVGGGIIGCFVAYFLVERAPDLKVVVIEPDPSYRTASTPRAASALRAQFNLGVNVAMSLFGWDFFAAAGQGLSVGGSSVDIGMNACPYLILSGADGSDRMKAAAASQNANGANVAFLDTSDLADRVPWLRTDGVSAATLGEGREGWIDPMLTLQAVRAKVISMGVDFVETAVRAMDVVGNKVVRVHLESGDVVSPGVVVNAAGAKAASVAAMADVILPVESRKRTAFVFSVEHPVVGFTNLVDPTFGSRGVYARPFGDDYLAVTSPDVADDVHTGSLQPDVHLFEHIIRPALTRRVRGFEKMTLQRSWAGHYEISTLDQNAFIGAPVDRSNFIMAAGFSGHGVMHAPATGRGIAELIIDGAYRSIDLAPLAVDRIARNEPLDDIQASEHRIGTAGV